MSGELNRILALITEHRRRVNSFPPAETQSDYDDMQHGRYRAGHAFIADNFADQYSPDRADPRTVHDMTPEQV